MVDLDCIARCRVGGEAPVFAWWHCPDWCSQDECHGGDTFDFGNGADTTSRLHCGVVFASTVPDVDGGTIDIEIKVEAVEDSTEGFLALPTVNINFGHLITWADTAQQVVDAILAATELARRPLPST
ncbi:hypothetical protein [Dactylosporangium sp. NPDC051484]|uniref:hypothetical protein n=1 Tax=Dactylosporangium sp. NPDC051484 TaxID=3154942 RepID=UPI00344FE29F